MFQKIRKYLTKKSVIALLLELLGVILLWRGIWGLIDLYLLPNHPLISNFICILIGFFFVWIDDKKLDELK